MISMNKIVRNSKRISYILPSISLLGIALIIWQSYVTLAHVNEVILPAPTGIMKSLWQNRLILWQNLIVTGEEILLGFVIGAVTGMILGIMIALSKALERAIYPLVIASQVIPIFAIAPLLIIWFGFGIAPKVLIAALIVFFPICVNQVEGIRSAEDGAIQLMRSYGAGTWRIFRVVQLPASVPFLLAGMQMGVTFSVIGAVIAEWVGAQTGLGALMLSADAQSNTSMVFAAIVTVAVLGVVLFALVRVIGNLIWPWQAIKIQTNR